MARLTDEEFRAWCQRNQIPPATEAYIQRVRSSQPVRKVRSGASNVSGRYPGVMKRVAERRREEKPDPAVVPAVVVQASPEDIGTSARLDYYRQILDQLQRVPLAVNVAGLLSHWRWFGEWSLGCIGVLSDWLVKTVDTLCKEREKTIWEVVGGERK